MKEIKANIPDVVFLGIGGIRMEAEGLISIAGLEDISVVGFWEVAKKYVFFKKLLDKSKDLIKTEKVDLFSPVDYPGFNLRLASYCKLLNIPVFYYIAPQLWAWGKNRAKHLAEVCNKLLVVFPFEKKYFSDFGIDTEFVGHPLLDYPEFSDTFSSQDEREKIIAFLPGSRLQEVKRHIPYIAQLSKELELRLPEYRIAVAKSPNIPESIFNNIGTSNHIELYNNSATLMKTAMAGVIKTGTSNLESCMLGLPFAMFYKTSFITYYLAKRMINLPYISIVNILSNKFTIKEFIQSEANPKQIIQYIFEVIADKDKYKEIQNNFSIIRKELGDGGAAKRAAKLITNKL